MRQETSLQDLEIGKEQSQLCYFDRKRAGAYLRLRKGGKQSGISFPLCYPRSREKRPGTMAWKLIIFPGRRERSLYQDF